MTTPNELNCSEEISLTDAVAKDQPHGWVTWWPAMGGGHKPIYSHGPVKPSYGAELDAMLRVYAVYDRQA